jgi:hypothetical protein
MPYNFSHLPEIADASELRRYMEEELRKISEALNETPVLEMRTSNAAPKKPRTGLTVYADGVNWNPGSGAGTYTWNGSAWVFTSEGTASTTEVLTGTDTIKSVTPDALAALWEKGSNVASAGTISLGEGGYFHITGTTGITDIDFATAKDGRTAILIFDGALTITHNATTLPLPGGANITTAAGDIAIVTQDAGDNVKVVSYTKANGQAIVSSAQVVRQVLQTTYATNADLTVAIPYDDTVPTSTEGTQILSQAITPADNTNKILCQVAVWGQGVTPALMIAALFRGTTCINVAAIRQNTAIIGPVVFSFLDSPASASAQTYSVRVGPDTGGTVRLNGDTTQRFFGGASVCTLTLSEIEA